MWKLTAILLLVSFCVHAEEEQTNKGPHLPSLVETVLCYASTKPRDCVRVQASRMLDSWDQTIEEKRLELMVEADEETKESETSRGLTEEEKKETPSQLMSSLDQGLSAIANVLTDGADVLHGRESRAMKSQSKDIMDDTNDFNDDYSILNRDEFEGNLTDESRGKKGEKQAPVGGNLNGNFGVFDDDSSLYGYGSYKGKGKKKKGKKHKKGMMKLFFIGAIIKSKIELLLKILSFKLQMKFFAIAALGLLINIARFWIDVKKQPQKVVYVEHAQHQHHYEDHDDWGSSWKRQAQQNQDYTQDNSFAHRLAYNAAPQYSPTY